MSHYKGRASPKEIEKDFPHIVEMRVPLGGFGSKLNAMYQWHEARGSNSCQNVPSTARVAAGAFGFLTLIQVFDGPKAIWCIQFL